MWNVISNRDDMDIILHLFGGFHDSCIKEMKYNSGAYVDERLSMYPVNKDRVLSVVFQRQAYSPSAIEIEFLSLHRVILNLEGADDYTCEISGASMFLHDDRYYWCDGEGVDEHNLGAYEGIIITCSTIRWRIADEYIGKGEVYKARKA